jgi:peptidoglycan hydrolase-like protein with peptidoglycan-binding domain
VLRVAVFLLSLYLFAGADAGTSRKPPMRSSVRQTTSLGAEAINDTSLTKLVTERSSGAAVIRAQILLGRANFSVGEIDGSAGINFRRSVIGFQNFRAIAPSGIVDQATWKALNVDSGPAIVPYRITKDDLAGAFEKIPSDMMEQAKLTKLGYQSVDEKLGFREAVWSAGHRDHGP